MKCQCPYDASGFFNAWERHVAGACEQEATREERHIRTMEIRHVCGSCVGVGHRDNFFPVPIDED